MVMVIEYYNKAKKIMLVNSLMKTHVLIFLTSIQLETNPKFFQSFNSLLNIDC